MNKLYSFAIVAILVSVGAVSAFDNPQAACRENGFSYAVSAFAWTGDVFERVMVDRVGFETSLEGTPKALEYTSNKAIYGVVTYEADSIYATTTKEKTSTVNAQDGGIDAAVLCVKRTGGSHVVDATVEQTEEESITEASLEITELEVAEVPEMKDVIFACTLLGALGIVAYKRS